MCLWKSKTVLFDDRKNSKSFGILEEFNLSLENYSLISIPPNIWNGFGSGLKAFNYC